MKTRLVFEYIHKESDGIGTSNDALICAVRALLNKIDNADSSDDAHNIFTKVEHLEDIN